MCLGKCFTADVCEKALTDRTVELSPDGKVLRYRVPGREKRSYYAGDTAWRQDAHGTWYVRETHTIELVLLNYLRRCERGAYLPELSVEVVSKLDNPHIRSNLVWARLNGLGKRELVYKGGSRWVISPEGITMVDQVMMRRVLRYAKWAA